MQAIVPILGSIAKADEFGGAIIAAPTPTILNRTQPHVLLAY
jgi:hypothetical protein